MIHSCVSSYVYSCKIQNCLPQDCLLGGNSEEGNPEGNRQSKVAKSYLQLPKIAKMPNIATTKSQYLQKWLKVAQKMPKKLPTVSIIGQKLQKVAKIWQIY